MIGLIVLGLAFLFFCVLAYFATRTWYTSHVVATAFLFLFTLVFLFLSATYFQTLKAFRPKYDKSVAELERTEQQYERLMHGDPAAPAGKGSKVGEQKLARNQQFTRGRVWRNVKRVQGPAGQILVSLKDWSNDGCRSVGSEEDLSDADFEPVADPEMAGGDAVDGEAAAPAADVPTHGLMEGQFVYAFKEFPIKPMLTQPEKDHYFGGLGDGESNFAELDNRGRCRVPLVYMGRYAIEKLEGQVAGLQPLGVLDATQIQHLNRPDQPGVAWVLYEKLPTDSHDLFDGVEGDKIGSLIPIQRLANLSGLPIKPAVYQAMVREYALDGTEVPMNRGIDPMRLDVEVEFLKEHTIAVDFEVAGDLPAGLDQPFNVDGRAQLPSLLQGEPTKFEVGETAVFDGVTAQRLVQLGLAKVVKSTYNRQLRDFEFLLQAHQEKFAEANRELAIAKEKVAALDSSLAQLQSQIDKQEAEFGLLQADLRGFQSETGALNQYFGRLTSRYTALKQQVEYMANAR